MWFSISKGWCFYVWFSAVQQSTMLHGNAPILLLPGASKCHGRQVCYFPWWPEAGTDDQRPGPGSNTNAIRNTPPLPPFLLPDKDVEWWMDNVTQYT